MLQPPRAIAIAHAKQRTYDPSAPFAFACLSVPAISAFAFLGGALDAALHHAPTQRLNRVINTTQFAHPDAVNRDHSDCGHKAPLAVALWPGATCLGLSGRTRHGEPKAMPQTIKKSVASLVEDARSSITELSADQAIAAGRDENTVLVDLRDPRELARDGRVPGAFHCPRGMLEFWIDPESPYHKPVFAEDKRFVFFCAGGLRSVLAAKTAQDMGLEPVAHIIGGFRAWKEAGGDVDTDLGAPGSKT